MDKEKSKGIVKKIVKDKTNFNNPLTMEQKDKLGVTKDTKGVVKKILGK